MFYLREIVQAECNAYVGNQIEMTSFSHAGHGFLIYGNLTTIQYLSLIDPLVRVLSSTKQGHESLAIAQVLKIEGSFMTRILDSTILCQLLQMICCLSTKAKWW